jgi:hypothetical protein
MDPVAAVVLCACALYIGLALLALLGRAGRSRLVAAWVAMVGFACLASFSFWKGIQLRRSAGPVYYDLPAAPGPHRVTLTKPGLSPGYRVKIVRRKDRTYDPELSAKLAPCAWRIPFCEKLALGVHRFVHGFGVEDVIEFNSEYDDVVLVYDATPETQPVLETALVELRCPADFHKTMAQWRSMLNSRMAFFLGGLILAGLGASVQRRKLAARAVPGDPRPPASEG